MISRAVLDGHRRWGRDNGGRTPLAVRRISVGCDHSMDWRDIDLKLTRALNAFERRGARQGLEELGKSSKERLDSALCRRITRGAQSTLYRTLCGANQ